MFTLICEETEIKVPAAIVYQIPTLFDMIGDLHETRLEVPWLSVTGCRAIIAALQDNEIPDVSTVEAFECARIDMTTCYPLTRTYEKDLLANGNADPYYGLLRYTTNDLLKNEGLFPDRRNLLAIYGQVLQAAPNTVIVGNTLEKIVRFGKIDKMDLVDFAYINTTVEVAHKTTENLYVTYQLKDGLILLGHSLQAVQFGSMRIHYNIHSSLSQLLHRLPNDVGAIAYDGESFWMTRRYWYEVNTYSLRDSLHRQYYGSLFYYIHSHYQKELEKDEVLANLAAQRLIDYHYTKAGKLTKDKNELMWKCIGSTLCGDWENDNDVCFCGLNHTYYGSVGEKIVYLYETTQEPLMDVDAALFAYLQTLGTIEVSPKIRFVLAAEPCIILPKTKC
jgi:hypothetical protein